MRAMMLVLSISVLSLLGCGDHESSALEASVATVEQAVELCYSNSDCPTDRVCARGVCWPLCNVPAWYPSGGRRAGQLEAGRGLCSAVVASPGVSRMMVES